MKEPTGLLLIAKRVRKSSFARSVGVLWGAEGLTVALGLIQTAVLARMLGPSGYGVAVLVMTYANVIYTFLDPASSEAVVRYLGEFLETRRFDAALAVTRLAYLVDGAIGLLSFVLIAASSQWAEGAIVQTTGAAWLITAFAAGLFLGSPGSTSIALLTSFGEFRTLAVARGLSVVLRTGLVLGLVASGAGVSGAVIGSAAGNVIEALLLTVLAHHAARHRLGGRWWQVNFSALTGRTREIARFIIYTECTSLLGVFSKQLDVLILGYFRNPVEVGYYRLALSFASIVDKIVRPLQSVVYPELARLAVTAPASLLRSAAGYARRVGLPLAAVTLAVLPLVPAAVTLVAGDEFAPAARPAQLLLASATVWLAFFWLRPLLFSLGKVKLWLTNAVTVVVVSVFGFVIAAQALGAVGVAGVRLVIMGLAGQAVPMIYLHRYRRAHLFGQGPRADGTTAGS